MSWIHNGHKMHTVLDLFSVCSYDAPLNYSGQETKSTWMRTQNFQLKLFDIGVTLKKGQGHWKQYEKVKLSEWYRHAKFDIYRIYGVWVNPNVKVFEKTRHLTGIM